MPCSPPLRVDVGVPLSCFGDVSQVYVVVGLPGSGVKGGGLVGRLKLHDVGGPLRYLVLAGGVELK